MALFPRKYRSLLYKLVVIIPVLWLTVMFIAHNSNSGSKGGLPGGADSNVVVPNDVHAGPHRKVLDGEGSGLRKHNEGQMPNNKADLIDKKSNIVSPTKQKIEVDR